MTNDGRKIERLIAVGDIHGCLDKLVRLMDLVQPSEHDQFVFVGDYIDRGADSKGVVDYLIDFGGRFINTVFLKGNHEDMLLRALGGDPTYFYHFIRNGGQQTIDSYGSLEAIPKSHINFFQELKLFYETEEFFIVHAGVNPAKELHEQDEHDLLWIREPFLESDRNFGKTIVHGHTPTRMPVNIKGRRINIDTGAFYPPGTSNPKESMGKLTAMNLLTGEIWQAEYH